MEPRAGPDVRPLLPLYTVIFAAFCGYALIVTLFIPMIMSDSGFVPAGASAGARTTLIGLLLAIYPLGQFVGSPIIGALSDRYGRRPVLLISLAVSTAAFLVIALGVELRSLILLGAGCLVGGLAESNIAIVQSAIADVAKPDHRARLFAWIYSASSVGYIAGPIGGGQLAALSGWSTPFWVVAAMLTATALWVLAGFRETHPGTPERRLHYLAAVTSIASVVTDRALRPLYLANFCFYFALFGFFRMILVYMADAWHMPVHRTTLAYGCLAVASIVGSFVLAGPLTRRFGLRRLATGSAVLSGGAMIGTVFLGSAWWWWSTTAPAATIGTLTMSACAALLANAVGPERQGRVMGNNQALQVGAEALSAAVGGVLAAIAQPLPLCAFGGLLIAAGLLLAALRLPQPRPVPGLAAATA